MNKGKHTNYQQSVIEDQAAEWTFKIDRGLTAEEQDQFTDWLSEHPDHKHVFSDYTWSWNELDRLAGLQCTEGFPADPNLLKTNKTFNYFREIAQLAAAVVFFVGFSYLGIRGFQNHSQSEPVVVQTLERIEQLNLADGSIVTLNHGAKIEEDFTEDIRLIRLLEGEACFDIYKDPTRPFVVEVGGVRFTALGTIFNVNAQYDYIDLIVTEGRVQITESDTTNPSVFGESPVITASQQALVFADTEDTLEVQVREISDEEISGALLWQPQMIDFENTPISVIVEEFNRRNTTQLKIVDPTLESLRLTSFFWSDNVNAFVRLLESNFDVEIIYYDEHEIHIRSNAP